MFKEERQQFKFEWSHLGDIGEGRPNLGPMTYVAVYRLMQFTLRDAIIKHAGVEAATTIFYDAGYNAGKAVYENMIEKTEDFDDLVNKLQKILSDLKIGILRVEEASLEDLRFVITVAEDLDCSGLPMMDEAVCTFDEGFIAGIVQSYTNVPVKVREIDCWGTGDRVCRFEVHKQA